MIAPVPGRWRAAMLLLGAVAATGAVCTISWDRYRTTVIAGMQEHSRSASDAIAMTFHLQAAALEIVDRYTDGRPWPAIERDLTLHRRLVELEARTPFAVEFRLADADGIVRASSERVQAETSIRGQGGFDRLSRSDILMVDGPHAHQDGARVGISRRRSSPTGRFDGIIQSMVPVEDLATLWAPVGRGETWQVALSTGASQQPIFLTGWGAPPLALPLPRDPLHWQDFSFTDPRSGRAYRAVASRVKGFDGHLILFVDATSLFLDWAGSDGLAHGAVAILISALAFSLMLRRRDPVLPIGPDRSSFPEISDLDVVGLAKAIGGASEDLLLEWMLARVSRSGSVQLKEALHLLTLAQRHPESAGANIAKVSAMLERLARQFDRILLRASPSGTPAGEVDVGTLLATLQPLMARMLGPVRIENQDDPWSVVAEPDALSLALFILAWNIRQMMVRQDTLLISTYRVVQSDSQADHGLPPADFLAITMLSGGAGQLARGGLDGILSSSGHAREDAPDGLGLKAAEAALSAFGGRLHLEATVDGRLLPTIYLRRHQAAEAPDLQEV